MDFVIRTAVHDIPAIARWLQNLRDYTKNYITKQGANTTPTLSGGNYKQ